MLSILKSLLLQTGLRRSKQEKAYAEELPIDLQHLLPSSNRISGWSGVLDLTKPLAKQLKPLRKQLRSRKVHEDEFAVFRRLNGSPGLFVDIGANAGQSAISFRTVNSSMNILSFEPNPLLEPLLKYLKGNLVDNFDYEIFGFSNVDSEMSLYIPVIDNAFVTPLASVERHIFNDEAYDKHLKGLSHTNRYELKDVIIKLRRFDDLVINPTIVKIDAEGHELKCLEGMADTIRRCSPLLMIEGNIRNAEILALLSGWGYMPMLFNKKLNRLVPFDTKLPFVNMFYLPADNSYFDQLLH